jgi:hypothetical protein
MFGTFDFALEIQVEEGVDKWLFEGVVKSEANQWFAGSGHGIDVELDGKILSDDLTEPMYPIAVEVDRSFYYHRTLIT